MTTEALTSLLITFGPKAFDLAEELVTVWNKKDPLTLEDIQRLRRAGDRTPADAVRERLLANGIDLQSEQAKQLIGLVS